MLPAVRRVYELLRHLMTRGVENMTYEDVIQACNYITEAKRALREWWEGMLDHWYVPTLLKLLDLRSPVDVHIAPRRSALIGLTWICADFFGYFNQAKAQFFSNQWVDNYFLVNIHGMRNAGPVPAFMDIPHDIVNYLK